MKMRMILRVKSKTPQQGTRQSTMFSRRSRAALSSEQASATAQRWITQV